MKKILLVALVPALALAAASSVVFSQSSGRRPPPAAPVPNPAMSAPDQTAWEIFIEAVRPPAAAGPVRDKAAKTTFETWLSDADTFNKDAKPTNAPRIADVSARQDQLDLRPPVLPSARQPAAHLAAVAANRPVDKGPQTPDSASQPPIFNPPPPGIAANGCDGTYDKQFFEPACDSATREEVRRNPAAYDYIVRNRLNSRAGLARAFKANMIVNFPVDAVEVKTNWIPVSLLRTYYPGVPVSDFYVATDMVPPPPGAPLGAKPVPYALIAMHVISKQVPNWTWATFEHQGNRGRCDFLGCKDLFGAVDTDVPPANQADGTNQGTVYANCAKTPALLAALRAARVDPAFFNYCLKGSQADFTDNNGLGIRVGNSVTESGFVPQASCMTCHGSANINSKGYSTTVFGFIGSNNGGNGQVGAINPLFYNSQASGRAYFEEQPGLVRTAISADFVWSIPFCAYDEDGKSGCSDK